MEQPKGSIHQDRSRVQAAEQFLHALYGDYPPGWLTIYSLPSKHTQWFRATHPLPAAQYAVMQAETEDVYLGVGLRGKRLKEGRGEAKDVIAIPGLWLDVDLKHPLAHRKVNLPETIHDVQTLIHEAIPLPPTILVDSGFGVHGYWLFRELWQFDDDAERDRAAHLLRRFQSTIIVAGRMHEWDLDSTFSLAQVLRIPGTYNHKVAGEDREVISR